jgi:hypothetical protein
MNLYSTHFSLGKTLEQKMRGEKVDYFRIPATAPTPAAMDPVAFQKVSHSDS